MQVQVGRKSEMTRLQVLSALCFSTSTEALGSSRCSLRALERKQNTRQRWGVYQGGAKTVQGLALGRKDMNTLWELKLSIG